MASLRQIRRRIRSVQSTQQITRAMEMVAASKLKRAQQRLFAARPYAQKLDEMVVRLTGGMGTDQAIHPLFEKRPVKNIAVAIITADKGMCGAYNANIIRTIEHFLAQQSAPNIKLVLIGKRGVHYFQRQKSFEILAHWQDFSAKLEFRFAQEIALYLTSIFSKNQVDEIYLGYTRFISGMTYQPTISKLLNIDASEVGAQFIAPEKGIDKSNPIIATKGFDYLYEPDADQLLNILLPQYVTIRVYIALASALTSEQSARMIAMQNATDNADEMIDQLTLLRNKLRQASITKEITEIVSGAEALNG
ncbi:MAG: ATP synthase F1 subunit gamma [bacterium]